MAFGQGVRQAMKIQSLFNKTHFLPQCENPIPFVETVGSGPPAANPAGRLTQKKKTATAQADGF